MKKIITLAIVLLAGAGVISAQSDTNRYWTTEMIDGYVCHTHQNAALYFLGSNRGFEHFQYFDGMPLFYFLICLPEFLYDECSKAVPDYFMRNNERNIYVTVRYYSRGTPCRTDRIICYFEKIDERIYIDSLYGYSYDIIEWLENYGDIELSVPLTDGSSSKLYVHQRS